MKSALLLITLLALAGCASPGSHPASPTASLPPQPAPTGAKNPDKRVTVDAALRGILQINQVRVTPSTQGYLQFQMDVENLGSSAVTVVYQVDWLDKDGQSLGISMDQPPCLLFAHETHPIIIASPTPTARDFLVTFRPRNR
jgi:uncharacterized protein YcfL